MRMLLLVALFATAGCAKDNKVQVECLGVGSGYNCAVAHQEGEDNVDACWTIDVGCTNGFKASANACQRMSPSSKASKFVPVADFEPADGCDAASSVSISGVRVTLAN